ncbi:MAG: metallophosphoesterase family protein [Pseudoruegeria sp.]
MKIKDLGELTGDVLLFGGPYSNIHATEALIDEAQRMAVPASNAICTGDVVAYGADPAATVKAIRSFGGPVVAGNCEAQLAINAADCGCGFDDGSACDLASRGWYPYANARITSDMRDWMAVLPDLIVFQQKGTQYAVIHGGVDMANKFIWPGDNISVFQQEIAILQTKVGKISGVISGHCGLAFERLIDGVSWVNAGVIGMPAHDGCPDTRYAVLRDGQFYIERLSYDYDSAKLSMERAGLTQGYQLALESGIWPSEDILPAYLKRG